MCFATDDDFCPILSFESSKVNGHFFFWHNFSSGERGGGGELKWLFNIVKILCVFSFKK